MLFLLLYPFRLIASGFYWARFRVGGAVRARMTSIELDNRMLWERNFQLEMRLANLEKNEAERKQAVLIEQTLQRFPEPFADPMGLDARVKRLEDIAAKGPSRAILPGGR